jgi:hypothetical protein
MEVHLDPSSDNELIFKEKVSDVYINLATTYSNVVAYMYDHKSKLIEKWSRETQSSYRSMFATDNYTLMFYTYRGLLTDYKNKTVHLEIKVVKEVIDRDLDDNEEHLVAEYDLRVGDTKMEELQ